MRNKIYFTICFFCCLLASSTIFGQSAKKSLSNDDIITMIKAELPENTIILAIQQSHGTFDISAQQLIRLKTEGASPKIMEAMIKSSESPQPARFGKPEQPVSERSDGSDDELTLLEVFLLDGVNKIQMKRSMSNPMASVNILNPFSGGRAKHTLNVNHAQLRITNISPMFELMLPADVNPSDHIQIVKMTPKSNRREIEYMRMRFASATTGFREKDVVPTNFEEFPKLAQPGFRLYRVKVVSPLSPGEYAFVTNGLTFYDFGVDSGKY